MKIGPIAIGAAFRVYAFTKLAGKPGRKDFYHEDYQEKWFRTRI